MLFKVNIEAISSAQLLQMLRRVGIEKGEGGELWYNKARVGCFTYASGNLLGFELADNVGQLFVASIKQNSSLSLLLNTLSLGLFRSQLLRGCEVTSEPHQFGVGIFLGPLPEQDLPAKPRPKRNGRPTPKERAAASLHVAASRSHTRSETRKEIG